MKSGSMKKGKGEPRTRVDKVAGAGKRIKCRYCDKEIENKNKHEKVCPQGPGMIGRESEMVAYQYCKFRSPRKEVVTQHEKVCRQGPGMKGRGSEMFGCQYCEFRSPEKGNRNKHEKVCPQGPGMIGRESEIVACQYCEFRSPHKEVVNRHEKLCRTKRGGGGGGVRPGRAAERGGGGGLVPSEDSKSRLLANCAVSHTLLRALDEAPLSLLAEQKMDEQRERADEEAYELEHQAKKGLAFLGLAPVPSKGLLFIVQTVAQIRRGLDHETATNNAVLVLAQTAVLDSKSMGNDPRAAAERRTKILAAKEILGVSGSPLSLNLSLMFAFLYAAGLVPVSCEFAGPGVDWDMGEQPGGKTLHKVILTDAAVASIPEVQSILLLRDVQQQVLFDTTTNFFVRLLAADGKVPAAAVICTMWNSYNGDILGALQGKWGHQHLMQPGPAKLLEDPTGGTNVVQLVLKMLHLSKMAWPQVKTQVVSIIKELREKAPLTD